MKSSYWVMPIWPRPRALTMPRVTVEFRPKGFPTASTYSPTCNCVASPQETVGRFWPSIFTTARSVFGSAPTILPLNSRLSGSVMVTVRAPSITWLLVRMYPSGDTMTPDPCPLLRCSRGSPGPGLCGPRNPRGPNGPSGPPKNSSIRSRSSSGTPLLPDTFSTVTVLMLTTAGVTAFATSANPFDGAALLVRATGAATEVAGLDAWEEDTDWLPQIRETLSTATAMAP